LPHAGCFWWEMEKKRAPTSSATFLSKDVLYLSVIVLIFISYIWKGYTSPTTSLLPDVPITPKMGISEGSRLPTKALKENNVMEASVNLSTIPGKIIIVGVPGAFTPTCSSQVPSYQEHAATFASKGIQGIYVLSVNDAFVSKAWKKNTLGENSHEILHFLADDTGEWTKAAGLELDMTPVLGGHRSKRYAAIVEDGLLKKIFIEEDASIVTVSGADKILENL